MDVRNETQIQDAVDMAVKTFGGIDVVVNNASAIYLTGTAETSVKNFDLMHDIIVRERLRSFVQRFLPRATVLVLISNE